MEPDDAIRLLAARPEVTGLLTDFDGTLSGIVPRPEDARPLPGAVDVLERLAASYALVGIVSGRHLDDLRSRVGASGVLLLGSYGRERSDGPGVEEPEADWGEVAGSAQAVVEGMDGVRVERKDAGVAVHFRGAPDREAEVDAAVRELARRHGLEVRPGRLVRELTVPGPGKGEAVVALAAEAGLETIAYAGDDVSDAEVFAALGELDATTLAVAISSEESPPELSRRADVVLDGPEAWVALLRELGGC